MILKVICPNMLDKFILEAPSIEVLGTTPTGELVDWLIYDEQSIFVKAGDAKMFIPVESGDIYVIMDNDGVMIEENQIELE